MMRLPIGPPTRSLTVNVVLLVSLTVNVILLVITLHCIGYSSKNDKTDKGQCPSSEIKTRNLISPKAIEVTVSPVQMARTEDEKPISSPTDNNTSAEVNLKKSVGSNKFAKSNKSARPVNDEKVKKMVAVLKNLESSASKPKTRWAWGTHQKGTSSSEILSTVKQAMGSEQEETRIDAIDLLSEVHDPQAETLLNQALEDPSEDVRSAALDVVRDQTDDIQLAVLQNGIKSPYADVKDETIEILEGRGDRSAVEILLKGLNDNDVNFRERVNEALSSLVNVDKIFRSYEEAQTWWNQNKDKYNQDLSIKDEKPIGSTK